MYHSPSLPSLTTPTSPLFPYTTLFRSRTKPMTRVRPSLISSVNSPMTDTSAGLRSCACRRRASDHTDVSTRTFTRSEEHTSELQSRSDLVCRLLLEKKKTEIIRPEGRH